MDDDVLVFHQAQEKVELLAVQVQLPLPDPGGAGVGVHHQVQEGKGGFRRGQVPPGPAHQGLQPGLENIQVKGLGQVVVRPGAQGLDLVRRLPQGGEHEHRGGVSRRPQLFQHLVAVELGHHHIQDDHVKTLPEQAAQPLFPVKGLGHVKPVLQALADVVGKDLVVLNNQCLHEPPPVPASDPGSRMISAVISIAGMR